MDVAGFDAAMQEQKAKARAAWAGTGETGDTRLWFDLAEAQGTTEFLGYDTESAEGQILTLVRDGAPPATPPRAPKSRSSPTRPPSTPRAAGRSATPAGFAPTPPL